MPPALLVAVWTAVAGTAGWFGRSLIHWLRAEDAWKRDEVRLLRQALDRLRRRENAYATGFELVLIVIPSELTSEQRLAVIRARQLFETALLHTDGGE